MQRPSRHYVNPHIPENQVWLLRGRRTGDLRILVINKDAKGKECGADVRLSPEQLKKYSAQGLAHYMYAAAGINDRCERLWESGAFVLC